MMGNVSVIPQRADPEIVAAFERMLDMAKRGEVVGFAVTYELPANQMGSESNFRDGLAMLGHLTRQISLVNRALDRGSAPE